MVTQTEVDEVLKGLTFNRKPKTGFSEHKEIDGKMGTWYYLTTDFVPTTKQDAELIKVIFDDGSGSMWLVPAPEESDGG